MRAKKIYILINEAISSLNIDKNKKTVSISLTIFVAGAVGLEPTTNGFGDHYSTN